MSADGAIVRAALEYAKRALDQIWDEGGTNQGIHIDPSLAALARLEAAEAQRDAFYGEIKNALLMLKINDAHHAIEVLSKAFAEERLG